MYVTSLEQVRAGHKEERMDRFLGIAGVILIVGVFFTWNLFEKNYRKENEEGNNL